MHKDGSVTVTRILRGLGYGLAENARAAIGQWRFTPGSRNGQPVEVVLNVEVSFNPQ